MSSRTGGLSRSIVTAVIGTAVATLFIAAALFWFYCKVVSSRESWRTGGATKTSFRREDMEADDQLGELARHVKGLVVDEGDADVIYLRRLDDRMPRRSSFPKVLINPSYVWQEEKRVDLRVEDGRTRSDPESWLMLPRGHERSPPTKKTVSVSNQHPSVYPSSCTTKPITEICSESIAQTSEPQIPNATHRHLCRLHSHQHLPQPRRPLRLQ